MIRVRDLTVIGKVVAGLIALAAAAVVLGLASAWWDDLWDWLPWSNEKQLERAEARADHAEADAANRRTEVVWLEKQQADVAEATRVIIETRTVTERAIVQAEAAPDASVEIDPGRADRLRGADRRLCELSSALCSGSTAPD